MRKDNEDEDDREEDREAYDRAEYDRKAPRRERREEREYKKPDKVLMKNEHGEKSDYYTGNKSKDLLVHIMQKGIEVDKPIKTKIYNQSVEWNRRQWAIVPERFVTDYNGLNHQYVDVNDVAVLTWKKDHEDKCKKCGGKMTVDAKESRALGRRGVFQAIWGLDNTHMILMIVIMIGAMAMAGGFFWAYSENTKNVTQVQANVKEIARLNDVIETYHNVTGITIGK